MASTPPPTQQPPPPQQQQKVSLWTTAQQRRQLDDLAELYAIFRATEKLEMAFARDAVEPDAYTEACQRLITQFKATEKALRQDGTLRDARTFVREYHLDCPRAVERLLVAGVPATIIDGGGGTGAVRTKGEAVLAAEATSLFITTMDTVKLNQRAVDALQPVLQDLVRALNKVDALVGPGFSKAPLQEWLLRLNSLRAADELDDDQMRQLSFDLENAYHSFMVALSRE